MVSAGTEFSSPSHYLTLFFSFRYLNFLPHMWCLDCARSPTWASAVTLVSRQPCCCDVAAERRWCVSYRFEGGSRASSCCCCLWSHSCGSRPPGGLAGFSYRIASVPRYLHPCLQDIGNDLCQEAEARRLSGSRGHAAPKYHLTFPL